MSKRYPAIYFTDKRGEHRVRFLDIDFVHIRGENRDHAKHEAVRALGLLVDDAQRNQRALPAPTVDPKVEDGELFFVSDDEALKAHEGV